MLTDLVLASLPLSIPSFYLAYRLARKDFLGTVFNQVIALMFLLSGTSDYSNGKFWGDLGGIH